MKIGGVYFEDFTNKLKCEIIAPESLTESVVETIVKYARRGKTGDGKIFIFNIEDAVRVRTGERGEYAIVSTIYK